MRLCRERTGYEVVPSQHKHLKLRHDGHGDMLLPLRPGDNLSYVAIKQIAAALGIQPEELIRQARWVAARTMRWTLHPLGSSEKRQLVSSWHAFGDKDVPSVRLEAKHVDPQLLPQALAQQRIHLRPWGLPTDPAHLTRRQQPV